jgi:hypothetical protein
VTFPPGCRRLATTPAATASPIYRTTIGIAAVACFAARVPGVPGHDDVDVLTDKLSRERRELVVFLVGPAERDDDGLAFHISEIAKA